ncbi:ABC transporter ATP-binding protein [Paenibacillus alvei]|uniref:ABC transporter ATP-binding protein n=1 Tax=Paenibacillus alvei TaxID=44250 RepID=A0ABT4H5Y4_PAEAL|nr:ABC transporter ATP-binding protein [Paenibacillus alvei]MBG9736365.1 peptide ABC transporter ATP-binding protein [Paenibacillus alvei]MBG9742893.1 peptide ABC transporter ATP-binding protein [Paenibacillus alvei]MCY9577829.1 ABC transporter ATP-binding protein [Paenibacillus alvei]MCY9586954.1 ABC transporter ATP-binding protein [Paenibacillus alvei]MCY9764034.1 ABC transporter ATP-binding protein [Paenibacillus alvei]
MTTHNDMILQVNDLHISFNTFAGKVQAVRGVDFELRKGETLAIVGESGSGKSVTNKAIVGILSKNAVIERGSIKYHGQDVTKYTEKQYTEIRGSKISMIFQDPLSSLNPVMKIGKQIMEALRAQQLSKADAKAKALELMEAVGIPNAEKRFHQYPFQFSGGMRQRIVIAIALACDPEVLICDEPTTALDVTIQAQILDLIKEIQKERQLSVIFITHDLGVVANVADRVAVMYAGKIVEHGTVDEIFYNPKHPYTWSLLVSMPDLGTSASDELLVIPGTPPNMLHPPKGDAFAPRNRYAMNIDFEEEPPMYRISDTHYAATWLLHPNAPKVELPDVLKRRIEQQTERLVR